MTDPLVRVSFLVPEAAPAARRAAEDLEPARAAAVRAEAPHGCRCGAW
ncbi:hypothetical protein ACF1BK_10910 [Streptomyces globisporus]